MDAEPGTDRGPQGDGQNRQLIREVSGEGMTTAMNDHSQANVYAWAPVSQGTMGKLSDECYRSDGQLNRFESASYRNSTVSA